MKHLFLTYFNKLFFEGWTIGIIQGSIQDIIRNRRFLPDIKWLKVRTVHNYYADPFVFKRKDGGYGIFVEEFEVNGEYGKISLLALDETLNPVFQKNLLDTKSHLSYPFLYTEKDQFYIFPEAGETGKLLCYEYNRREKSIQFVKEIMDVPVVDPTILYYNNKYWLFGGIKGAYSHKQLYLYFSDNLLGPYKPHPQNPVKEGLNGSRCAGKFIEIDGEIYRPSQNCQSKYGESIILHKMNVLDEFYYDEEPYMEITIDKKNRKNRWIDKIHTINAVDDIIVVDGGIKIFSPMYKLKEKIAPFFSKKNKK
jgi:hypothetical protein